MSLTNWPTLTNGPLPGTHAARAAFYSDRRPFYGGFMQGDYIAVTNMDHIDYLTNGTISVWSYASSNSYNTTTLMGNMGTAQVDSMSNSWDLARDGENFRFRIGWPGAYPYGHITNVIYFYDDTIGHGSGPDGFTQTNWVHYTVTWSQTDNQIIGYQNGVAIGTSDMFVPWLRLDSSGGGTPWLGIGVNPHSGTPQMDYVGPGSDEFPNNGWFVGKISDVRIYNRTLTPSEVAIVYAGGDVLDGVPAAPRVEPAKFRAGGKMTIRGKLSL